LDHQTRALEERRNPYRADSVADEDDDRVDVDGKINYNDEDLAKVPAEVVDKVKKAKNSNELIFEVEGWGQLDVKDIFIKAIGALDANLKELDKAVK